MHAQKEAKLGDENKFFFDKERGIWREAGAEIPAAAGPLPPPPTAARPAAPGSTRCPASLLMSVWAQSPHLTGNMLRRLHIAMHIAHMSASAGQVVTPKPHVICAASLLYQSSRHGQCMM